MPVDSYLGHARSTHVERVHDVGQATNNRGSLRICPVLLAAALPIQHVDKPRSSNITYRAHVCVSVTNLLTIKVFTHE